MFMITLGLAESFKTMNRPDWADRNALWRPISQKLLKIVTLNFEKIFIQVFNLCYQFLGSTYLIIWNYALFGNVAISIILSTFFHYIFRPKSKFYILKVSSERSSSDISDSIEFNIKINKKWSIKNNFWVKKR